MLTIKDLFDLIMPEVTLPEKKEMLGDFIRVHHDDIELRKAMHTIAKYFMREIQNDYVLFPNPRSKFYDDKECYAYLLTLEKSSVQMKSVVIGGFCFRLRSFGYGMQWIWLHPYARNTGVLGRHWKLLEDKFGKDFYCEPPYTHAMQAFLNRHDSKSHRNHENLKEIPMWHDKVM